MSDDNQAEEFDVQRAIVRLLGEQIYTTGKEGLKGRSEDMPYAMFEGCEYTKLLFTPAWYISNEAAARLDAILEPYNTNQITPFLRIETLERELNEIGLSFKRAFPVFQIYNATGKFSWFVRKLKMIGYELEIDID